MPKLRFPGAFAAVCAVLCVPLYVSRAHAEDAFSLSAAYRGDFWGNVDGGVKAGHRYFDDLLVGVTVDMERAVGLSGGTLHVIGLHNDGAHFSDHFVGAAQAVSSIETTSAFHLFEAWYDQSLLDDTLSVRAGLYDLNSEFDFIDAGALFLNSSQGMGFDLGQTGHAGPSTFPVTSLAARVQWNVTPDVTLRAAVTDGVPGDPAHPKRFVDVKLGQGDGALIAGEIETRVLGAIVAAGAWGYTASFDDVDTINPLTGAPLKRSDNRGAYVEAERRVYSVSDEEGLSVYARFGVAESHINVFSSYLGAGAVYDNIAPNTSAGFAVASAKVGAPYRRAQAALGLPSESRETIFEVTAHTHLTPWLGIQPDVQYVVNPALAPGARNALVLGLRFEIFGATSF